MKYIFVHILFVITSLTATLCISELITIGLSNYSYNIKVLSSNPFKEQLYTNISNWKDLIDASCCPQIPGSNLNGFIINSHGFATPETPYQKPNGAKRLVLIGDSQTVGVVPYPEHFSRLMESSIRQKHPNFEVINLGMNGIGPLFEEKVLEVEGRKYQPDVVVLSFFVGNDFFDDMLYEEKYKLTNHLLPLWAYKSRAISFARNTIHLGLKSSTLPSSKISNSNQLGVYIGYPDYDPHRKFFNDDSYIYLESERANILKNDSKLYINLDAIQKSILRMKTISEQVGAKFIVLIIPDEFQTNRQLLSKIINNNKNIDKKLLNKMKVYIYQPSKQQEDWSKSVYDIELPQKTLTEFFVNNNIEYIDLLQKWKNDPNSTEYYQPNDTHLNAKGNLSVANIITPTINSLLELLY